jgi:hypothetical protein
MHRVLQLFYVMNKAVQLPLRIHFRLSSQGQFVHAFIDCNIPLSILTLIIIANGGFRSLDPP